MADQPLRRRLQGLFWEHSQTFRLPLRRLKRRLSLTAYRLRSWESSRSGKAREQPRVIPRQSEGEPLAHPAITIAGDPQEAESLLRTQTETSAVPEGEAADTPYWLPAPDSPDLLPATWLESLLLAAASENLALAQAGFSPPAEGIHGPSGNLYLPPGTEAAAHTLVRRPGERQPGASPVLGKAVPQITHAEALRDRPPLDHPLLSRVGPYLLSRRAEAGRILHQDLRSPHKILSRLPPVPGPRTALFLLPFLAVGGAESLLYDLLDGLREDFRCLVVTFEPHLASRGQSVDRCRLSTDQVYTLGDWLPREANLSALMHLLRRYRVESLICWNGTVDFYDGLPEIKAAFPDLRVLSQHYNHRGAWIERTSPSLIRHIDVHLAVNRLIARSLEKERGVPSRAIRLVHHGVSLPPREASAKAESAARAARRRRARERLGLPLDAVVAGTFVRLHPQKRPGDVLHLARRLQEHGLWFLLAGGGPLDADIDRRLAANPIPNLLRLPMQEDVEPLYDAVDLCLSTSAYEGLPVFLLDGLARGLPCVATAVGDIPFLLADGGGLLADSPGHLDSLHQALLRMLDPDFRQREGDKGRRRVEDHFSLDPYRQRYREAIFPRREESSG